MGGNKSKRRKAGRRKPANPDAERRKPARPANPDAGRRKAANPDAGRPVKPGVSALDRLTRPLNWGLAALLLLTGAVLRLLYLGEIPFGLNQDEASSGYEAWALMQHGIDRNGYAWPVHFVSWGSGQNALYAYLSMPIIAILDLTVFSTRLLMALTGIASLLLFWRVAARDQPAPGSPRGGPGAGFALLALLLLALCPWHLMLSRWALESNILPFVILFSVYFFTRPDNHRPGIQAAGVLVLSLSVYAYGTAYFFAPLFLACCFGWLRVQGKLPLRRFVLLSALSLLTVLPILLFLAVNFFNWEAIRAGISMPKYTGLARYEQISTVFGGRFLANFVDQLLFAAKLLTTSDPVPTEYFNKMSGFAVLFPFAIVPLAFGFATTLYRAVKLGEFGVPLLMALWLIAALATVSVSFVNINRANVVWLPAVYFTALGVFYACRRWRVLLAAAAAAYLVYGGWFAHTYFTQYNNDRGVVDYRTFHDLRPAISSVVERAGPNDKIYITPLVHEAYMLTLFHTKTPPRDYLATRIIPDPHRGFQKITSFGNFIFTPERAGEADYLVLYFKPGRGILMSPREREQIVALDAVGRCDTEYHGNFAVLHCG